MNEWTAEVQGWLSIKLCIPQGYRINFLIAKWTQSSQKKTRHHGT